MTTDSKVSCEWLKSQIEAGLKDIVIVDVSWSSTKDCLEEYKKCHIPGARHINMLDADHTDLYPRNIPSPDRFTSLAQQAGVSSSSHVIVYSNTVKAGYFLAGRGWWTFKYYGQKKVSILDGGLAMWLKKSLPTTDELPEVSKPGDFVANPDQSFYASYDEIVQNVDAAKFQLIDTRAAEAYEKAHIPGAKNVPLDSLIDQEEEKLKNTDKIKAVFQAAGVDLDQPIATHCNSGMSSCSVLSAAHLLGVTDARLFHGGFTEWSKKQNLA